MSTDQRTPKRRTYVTLPAPKHAGRVINVQSQTSNEAILDSAKMILKHQFDALSAKARMGGQLQDVDAKILRTHIQSFAELLRTEREENRNDGVDDWVAALTKDELIALAQGQLAQSVGMDNALDTTAVPVAELVEDKKE